MAAIALTITGLTCGHCRKKAEDALKAVRGVWSATVDLETGAADVEFDDKHVQPDALIAAVEAVGYHASLDT
jgi:copper chaperone CopZ